jgi:hypothetical protein
MAGRQVNGKVHEIVESEERYSSGELQNKSGFCGV